MSPAQAEERIRAHFDAQAYDAAVTVLIEAFAADFYRTALRITMDPALADDVIQEASIRIWQKMPDFRGDAKFSTWTYRIIVNESLNQLRKQRKFTQLDGVHAERLTSSAMFHGDEILEELYRAMATLPDKQRITFQMRYFEDLPFKEIAARLNQSEGGLKANYHHAVKKIKNHFESLNLSLSTMSIG